MAFICFFLNIYLKNYYVKQQLYQITLISKIKIANDAANFHKNKNFLLFYDKTKWKIIKFRIFPHCALLLIF